MNLRQHLRGEVHRIGIELPEPKGTPADLGTAAAKGTALESARADHVHSGGEWADYTPTLTSSGTSPTMGTGAEVTGRYVRIGNTVIGWASLKFGSAGAAAGTGTYRIALPFTPRANAVPPSQRGVGGGTYIYDNSVAEVAMCTPYYQNDSNTCYLIHDRSGGGVVTATSPWTWANGDEIRLTFFYEAA